MTSGCEGVYDAREMQDKKKQPALYDVCRDTGISNLSAKEMDKFVTKERNSICDAVEHLTNRFELLSQAHVALLDARRRGRRRHASQVVLFGSKTCVHST